MIMTVTEAREYITTAESDSVLEARLQALESLIRKFTNNNFQKRNFRIACPIIAQKLYFVSPLFKVGDTIQISNSEYNEGVYTITDIDTGFVAMNEDLIDEAEVLVTKIEYPADVKMGVIAMLKWEMENREKVGIASETISRHSVTYTQMDGDNSSMGFPKALVGFLKPYIKARF